MTIIARSGVIPAMMQIAYACKSRNGKQEWNDTGGATCPHSLIPAVLTPAIANRGWVRMWEESKDKTHLDLDLSSVNGCLDCLIILSIPCQLPSIARGWGSGGCHWQAHNMWPPLHPLSLTWHSRPSQEEEEGLPYACTKGISLVTTVQRALTHTHQTIKIPACPSVIEGMNRRKREQNNIIYDERVRGIEHGSFSPLVFLTAGGVGNTATVVYKRLVSLLAEKRIALPSIGSGVNWTFPATKISSCVSKVAILDDRPVAIKAAITW